MAFEEVTIGDARLILGDCREVMQRLLKPATDENGSPVLQREYARLKKIEAMAMACDGIDMGRHYEVPTEAWEALVAAVWDDIMANALAQGRGA